ncbi:ketopantoate reductase family protein [Virgibacillus salinus]|uniref:2-dehydropantoate 2-reductase n=1 Tax=Virgibacillus salinus TaxID=553311 RepID=A0A1H1FV52_9BACI|nr:2-dehydropantoate 2-reductase [Virgibacillus salinus]SDR04785.1 ketopantoate reductase [Virgibacillus salinus]
MHIVVLGAGALGGYFGSRWEEAGADVTYLVREKRAKQLHEQGMKVNSTQGNYSVSDLRVVTDVHNIENPGLVFVSVKGYHLTGTLEDLKVLVDKGAFVLPVLNGIEHISVLQDYLGEESVIGGLSFIVATLNDDGHVEHSSEFHKLVFGPLNPKQSDICQQLRELSSKAKLETIYSDSILQELWKKYLFINAFSGITTATDLPIGPVRDNKDTLKVAELILNEMQQLANSYNIEITDEDVAGAKSNLQNFGYDATSSMHQDRRKGQTLELDHLHGGALRLAEAKGLKLPFTEAVHGIIKPFEGA